MLLQTKNKSDSEYQEVKFLRNLKIENTPEGLYFALKAICEFAGWDYGEIWIPCAKGMVLEMSPIYYIKPSPNAASMASLELFQFCSESLIMPPNVGLPGRVWLSENPEWIPDLSSQSERYFLRNKIAKACGVKTGLGIPFIVKSEVEAVLLFFKTV